MLPALLRTSEHLSRGCIAEIKLLGDGFPVEVGEIFHTLAELLLVDDVPEQLAFLGCPVAVGKIGLAYAEPLEHAATAADPGDQSRDSFPIFKGEFFVGVVDVVPIAVLGDDPHEDLHILLAPVLLQFLVLHHLIDAPGDQSDNGLVADVRRYHFLVLVDLLAVLQDILPDLALAVLVQIVHEGQQPLPGLVQSGSPGERLDCPGGCF